MANRMENEASLLRIGIAIRLHLDNAYGEGLLQYIGLLLNGAHGKALVSLYVVSGRAFEQWRRTLPLVLQDGVRIVSIPTPSGDSSETDWIMAAESEVDCWLSLRPDDVFLVNFRKPVISLFADFVYADYPELYDVNVIKSAVRRIQKVEKYISKYVCFSSYVKKKHAVNYFGIADSKISIIPHGRFDYSYLSGANFPDKKSAGEAIRSFLSDSQACRRDVTQRQHLSSYLSLFPYEDVPYVFMSTRNRPHKNTITVVEATSRLLKEYYNIKLFTTAPIMWDNPHNLAFDALVIRNKLHMDVVSMNDLPPKIHAALYKCASVTVHPSPFEGGFPFTAFESLSVGTPVLLADGPIVREFIPTEMLSLFVFQPTSVSNLAARIKEVVENREEILQKQQHALSVLFKTFTSSVEQLIDVARSAKVSRPAGDYEYVVPGNYHFGSDDLEFLIPSIGWFAAEDWGRWASEQQAKIRFLYSSESRIESMTIHITAPPVTTGQKFVVSIYFNGLPITSDFSWNGEAEIKIDKFWEEGLNEIVLCSKFLCSPYEVGMSTDQRRLGVGVARVVFSESKKNPTFANDKKLR